MDDDRLAQIVAAYEKVFDASPIWTREQRRVAMANALSALRPGDRIGNCVLVPVEPTEAMSDSGALVMYRSLVPQFRMKEEATKIYRTMIAAAKENN